MTTATTPGQTAAMSRPSSNPTPGADADSIPCVGVGTTHKRMSFFLQDFLCIPLPEDDLLALRRLLKQALAGMNQRK